MSIVAPPLTVHVDAHDALISSKMKGYKIVFAILAPLSSSLTSDHIHAGHQPIGHRASLRDSYVYSIYCIVHIHYCIVRIQIYIPPRVTLTISAAA